MKRPKVDESLCVGCAQCFLICPDDAMDVFITARPDDKCTGCARCVGACPCGAIEMVDDESAEEQ